MLPALQAGFGDPLGAELLAQIKGLGYQAVRLEQGRTAEQTQALAIEVLAAGLTPIVILFDATHASAVPAGSWCCVENEPDLPFPDRQQYPRGAMEDLAYIDLVWAVCEAARPEVRVVAGECSNPNRRGRAFMEAVCPYFPARAAHSWHRYPHGGRGEGVMVPHPGFRSRWDEAAYLMELAEGQSVAITEAGYHTAPRGSQHWLARLLGRGPRRWTDADVARLWAAEWAFWQDVDVEYEGRMAWVTKYQLNDGDNPDDPLHTYGIRTVTGEWKESAPAA